MKDNNLNNTKNVRNIDDIEYKPEGQISKYVCELLTYSKEGNIEQVKKLIDKFEFQGSTLNLALCNSISAYKHNNSGYFSCLKLLLSSGIDLLYKFPKKNNSTIMMLLSQKLDIILIKQFLENIHLNSNFNVVHHHGINNMNMNDNEEDNEIKEIKDLFSQTDSNGNTFFHYLKENITDVDICSLIDYIYEEYPKFLKRKEDKVNKIKLIIKNTLDKTNNEGNKPINLFLINGWSNLILKILSINGYSNHLNEKKNNLVHCAVLGHNIRCLKIVLFYCSYDELNAENADKLTPAQLAYKLGYFIICSIITEYKKNFYQEGYKNHFYLDKSSLDKKSKFYNNLSIDLLVSFKNHTFKSLYYELNEIKIQHNISYEYQNINMNNTSNNNIDDLDDLLYKISLLKINWNILLTKIKINETDYDKNSISKNNNDNIIINKNKKKTSKNNKNNKYYSSYKEIYDLYENNFSDKIILSLIEMKNSDTHNSINNINIIITNSYLPCICILIYNKIIFFYKLGLISSLVNTAKIYLTKIFQNDNITNNNYSWTLYVNISFILIEIFIYHRYENLAGLIIESLEEYLFTNCRLTGDAIYTLDDEIIFKYLNQNEILNPFSTTWDETFCYSNFWKIIINKDKTNDYFNNYKKLMHNCKYSNELPVFNRLQILYTCIEIKKLYDKEEDNIYDKLTELKIKGVDSEIYYLNIIGIIYLKKKKYIISKLIFTLELNKYIQIIKIKYSNTKDNNTINDIDSEKKEKFYNFKMDYYISIKYNIFLCHFYLKEYEKGVNILEQLIKYKKNYIFYYRLGLCYLHLYLEYYNKQNDYFNKSVLKLIGYEKNINKKCKNEKSLSIDLDNDSTENLSYQFEAEYKDKYNNRSKTNISNSKDGPINQSQQKINQNYKQISLFKKIILRNTNKIFRPKDNTNAFNINENNNNNNNIITPLTQNMNKYNNYLELSLKYLKKVVNISKDNKFSDSLESIYKFYSKEDKSPSNKNNNKNYIKKKKIPNEILIDTYLNILFCLSIKNNWLEMLHIIKDFNNRKINLSKGITVKVLLYKLESYIHLNNTQKSREILNKIKGYKKIDLSVINKSNNDILNHINIKLYVYYTMIILNLKTKNYKEVDVNINKILSFIKNEENIPYYIIDLLINIYLNKLHNNPHLNEQTKTKYNNIIINLIKNKRTDYSIIKK